MSFESIHNSVSDLYERANVFNQVTRGDQFTVSGGAVGARAGFMVVHAEVWGLEPSL